MITEQPNMQERNPDGPSVVPDDMSTQRTDTSTGEAQVEDAGSGDPPRKRRFGAAAAERFREHIRSNKVLNTTWRVTVFTVGVVVVLAGLVMLLTPGPGWLGIVLGFAILASEFVWARRALRRAKRAAKAAKDKALDPKVRRRNQILTIVAGLAVAGACIAYFSIFGLTFPWDADIADKLPWVASLLPNIGHPA